MNDFLVKFCGSYALVVIERRDLDVRSEIKNKGDSFNKKTTIRDSKVFIS